MLKGHAGACHEVCADHPLLAAYDVVEDSVIADKLHADAVPFVARALSFNLSRFSLFLEILSFLRLLPFLVGFFSFF
jgi:hypothetical protein